LFSEVLYRWEERLKKDVRRKEREREERINGGGPPRQAFVAKERVPKLSRMQVRLFATSRCKASIQGVPQFVLPGSCQL
jgi:hypothetical protein